MYGYSWDDDATVLDEGQCWDLIRAAPVGRLAMAISGCPEIFPVNFAVDHGTVVFRTAAGTKLAATILPDPVAFEVDGYEPGTDEAWSVIIKGHAHEITRTSEVFDSLKLPLSPWHAAPKNRFVRVVPGVITGRRFRVADPRLWDASAAAAAPLPPKMID